MLKGQSYTTGVVHYAKTVSNPAAPGGKSLAQLCGTSRRQIAYLASADESAQVTCKRCERG